MNLLEQCFRSGTNEETPTGPDLPVVGEADDWSTTVALAQDTESTMLFINWELLPIVSGHTLAELREVCPEAVVIVLISQLDTRQHAAISAGAEPRLATARCPTG